MSDYTLTIEGKACAADKTFGVINPATEEVFAQAPDASKADLDAAVDEPAREDTDDARDDSLRDRKGCGDVQPSHRRVCH